MISHFFNIFDCFFNQWINRTFFFFFPTLFSFSVFCRIFKKISKSSMHFIWTSATLQWWSGFVIIYNYTFLHDSENVCFLFSHVCQELRVKSKLLVFLHVNFNIRPHAALLQQILLVTVKHRIWDKVISAGYLHVPGTTGQETNFLSRKKIFSELQNNFHYA